MFGHDSKLEPPKKLHSHTGDATRRVVTAGDTVHLPCPVERNDKNDLFIDWTRDDKSLPEVDARMRVTNSGTLRIKDVQPDDTGLYVCKAVNGFGSVEIGSNLIVLENELPAAAGGNINNHTDSDTIKPRLTQVSRFNEQVIERPAGSSIKFKCEATGHPRPSVSWFYNNHILQSTDQVSRRGRWTLVINDLTVEDSGNYTCFVVNQHGNTSASFVLNVVDEQPPTDDSRPSFEWVHNARHLPEVPRTRLFDYNNTFMNGINHNDNYGGFATYSPKLVNNTPMSHELFLLPMPIIVATIGFVFFLLVLALFTLIHCRNQKRSSSSSGSPLGGDDGSGSSRSNFHPSQPSPSHYPCKIQQPMLTRQYQFEVSSMQPPSPARHSPASHCSSANRTAPGWAPRHNIDRVTDYRQVGQQPNWPPNQVWLGSNPSSSYGQNATYTHEYSVPSII